MLQKFANYEPIMNDMNKSGKKGAQILCRTQKESFPVTLVDEEASEKSVTNLHCTFEYIKQELNPSYRPALSVLRHAWITVFNAGFSTLDKHCGMIP